MESASTVDFAHAARVLARGAGRLGLAAPSFRCPPRLVGCDRSIRRRRAGTVVSVRVRGRPRSAVLADMIEGVVVANRLVAPEADRARSELWRLVEPGATAGGSPTIGSEGMGGERPAEWSPPGGAIADAAA